MNKGVISLSDELVIASGYTFEQFRNTRYYKGQNPESHDEILRSWEIARSDQEWGYVESVYDARSNISSINIGFV